MYAILTLSLIIKNASQYKSFARVGFGSMEKVFRVLSSVWYITVWRKMRGKKMCRKRRRSKTC